MTGETLDFDPRVDYYAALGVAPSASDAEIKRAYRKLAKEYHPDRTGGDKAKEQRFKDVTRAYEVLGDKQRRARYDAIRAGGFAGAGAQAGGIGFDIGDLFAQMFGSRAGGRSAPRGQVRYEVFTGGDGPSGGGSPFGSWFDQDVPRPRAARPSGRTVHKVRTPTGAYVTLKGDDVHSDVRIGIDQALLGAVVEVPTLTGTAKLKIPPGTSSGTKLRLRGKGRGAGDHYVTVHIDVPKKKLDGEGQRLLAALMKKLR
ncbi:MAG: J domain-containing protein [Deltaproteobacteria bacterium]|nr:MAG: J domain-containing protein [Deltaproteobacteria bacterium]